MGTITVAAERPARPVPIPAPVAAIMYQMYSMKLVPCAVGGVNNISIFILHHEVCFSKRIMNFFGAIAAFGLGEFHGEEGGGSKNLILRQYCCLWS